MSLKSTMNALRDEGKTLSACEEIEFMKLISQSTSEHDNDGKFHPSVIAKLCARALCYPMLRPNAKSEEAKFEKELRFELGTFAHVRTQIRLCITGCVAVRDESKRLESKREKKFAIAYAGNPSKYLPQMWKYCRDVFEVECRVNGDADNVTGSYDALLIKPRRAVLEYKSWNERRWMMMRAPEPDHIIQGNVYIRYANDVDCVIFRYEELLTCHFKEYIVEHNTDAQKKITEVLRTAKHALKINEMPARMYREKSKQPCAWCKWRDDCYGIKRKGAQ